MLFALSIMLLALFDFCDERAVGLPRWHWHTTQQTLDSDSGMSSTARDSYSTVPSNEYRPGPMYLIAWTRSVTVAVPRHRNSSAEAQEKGSIPVGC